VPDSADDKRGWAFAFRLSGYIFGPFIALDFLGRLIDMLVGGEAIHKWVPRLTAILGPTNSLLTFLTLGVVALVGLVMAGPDASREAKAVGTLALLVAAFGIYVSRQSAPPSVPVAGSLSKSRAQVGSPTHSPSRPRTAAPQPARHQPAIRHSTAPASAPSSHYSQPSTEPNISTGSSEHINDSVEHDSAPTQTVDTHPQAHRATGSPTVEGGSRTVGNPGVEGETQPATEGGATVE
jgi:hypothetical protein